MQSKVVNWNRCYGFYQPARPVVPVPGAAPQDLQGLLSRPFRDVEEARRFLVGLGILPSFHPIAERVGRGAVDIQLEKIHLPTYDKPRSKSPRLTLPKGKPVAHYLGHMMTLLFVEAPLPKGLMLPPGEPSGGRQEVLDEYWLRHSWMISLARSFLYQLEHEREALDLGWMRLEGMEGILKPSDLALFRIFRESGLAGAAAVYPQFMSRDAREMMGDWIEMKVANIFLGGGKVGEGVTWEPPPVEGRPDLPRTKIDERADHLARFDRGLFVGAIGLSILRPGMRAEIQKKMELKVRSLGDPQKAVQVAIGLLIRIAPVLAGEMLGTYERGEVVFEWAPEGSEYFVFQQPTLSQLMGSPVDTWRIQLHPRSVIGDIFLPLVRHLAVTTLPSHIHRYTRFPETGSGKIEEIEGWAHCLEQLYRIWELWGWTAMIEFHHEAIQRGLPYGDVTALMEIKKVLIECGFSVLCERGEEFRNLSTLTVVQGPLWEIARRLVESRSP